MQIIEYLSPPEFFSVAGTTNRRAAENFFEFQRGFQLRYPESLVVRTVIGETET